MWLHTLSDQYFISLTDIIKQHDCTSPKSEMVEIVYSHQPTQPGLSAGGLLTVNQNPGGCLNHLVQIRLRPPGGRRKSSSPAFRVPSLLHHGVLNISIFFTCSCVAPIDSQQLWHDVCFQLDKHVFGLDDTELIMNSIELIVNHLNDTTMWKAKCGNTVMDITIRPWIFCLKRVE